MSATITENAKGAIETPKYQKDFPLTGKYGSMMAETFHLLQSAAGIEQEQAWRAAHAIGCEFGKLISGKADVSLGSIKVGKVSDGKVTLREAGTAVKGAYLTHGLLVLKIVASIAEVHKLGAEVTGYKLPSKQAAWIAELGKE